MEALRQTRFVPMTDRELLSLARELFGSRRSFELLGWATWWLMSGQFDLIEPLIKASAEQGYSKSATYRAIKDFRRLRREVAIREGREPELQVTGSLGADVPLLERLVNVERLWFKDDLAR